MFYIPKKYKDMTPFLLIKDSENKKDILRLTRVSNSNRNYNVFAVSLTNSIVVSPGISAITLMILEKNIVKSISASIILKYENFNIAKQIVLIDNLSKGLVATSKKIEEMTRMNIEIHQSIEEAINK